MKLSPFRKEWIPKRGQGVPTHSCTRWLSNWTHTQRFLLAQAMFGCVNAGHQVWFRSHLEKQDTSPIGTASSESDPCVRKTGYCPPDWLVARFMFSEYCNITSFPVLPLCFVWRRRIKDCFYSMAMCKEGWRGVSWNCMLPLLSHRGPLYPCYSLTSALMGIFHSFIRLLLKHAATQGSLAHGE